ncbi:tomoregulin-2-like [Pecten maximus]|uniref:tomoregulin-2-like n=1 Tax=Pecten maximus TaxID=6579 RepID=UPI0014589BFF|nr:tomoregulin-2-like [Pecten maximus]XP_033748672.1 tomoregulin-2-like [Pecten maximus]
MTLIKLLAIVCYIAACSAQSSNWFDSISCRYIEGRDCYRYGNNPECGTDGVTYRNRCDFSKAHCANKDIHVYAYDSCANVTLPGGSPSTAAPGGGGGVVSTVAPPVTIAPTPAIHGSEAVLDFICLEISHEKCGMEVEQICASDFRTYENACEFQKAKCTHRELHVLAYRVCPTGSP